MTPTETSAAGFTALKVRVGRGRTADDLAAVRRVRAAVGDEVTLVADYNQGLSLGGVTGWLRAAAIADVTGLPMSSHLYPEVSGHLLRVTPTSDQPLGGRPEPRVCSILVRPGLLYGDGPRPEHR
jgi:L-alanine-DL-glutamate epimerase-like enolase superfamily enzyme